MALAQVFETFAGPNAPVQFVAYDGSRAGAEGSPVRITVRSPVAVSYLAQAPGALGLARAYVSGHLDVDGDIYSALAGMAKAQTVDIDLAARLRLLRDLGGPRTLLPRLAPPPQEVSPGRRWLTGRRHSKGRDANAISHHYDVSNRFYEWVLGRQWLTPAPVTRLRSPLWNRPRSTSSTWSHASSGCAAGCGCSTSAAAGAAWSCTRPVNTASARSGSRCPNSRPPGPRRRSRKPDCPAWRRFATSTTGMSARPASTR